MPLPPIEEVLAGAAVVRLPMRVRFRGLLERDAVLLRGVVGWAEFAPFDEYDDVAAARWLAAALASGWTAPVPPVRDIIPVNATVPAVAAADVAGVLARFPGCTTVKVKVAEPGQDLGQDVDRVAAVLSVLGSAARLRVDANGAWSVREAVDALRRLVRRCATATFEYAEQPCATLAELAELRVALARAGVDVAVAADESVRTAADPRRVALAGAADVVLLKVAPLGGVRAALEIAQVLGADHGVATVVSSALDTSIGIAAGVELAAALPELRYACGLATVGLLRRDVAQVPLTARAGTLSAAAARALIVDDDAVRQLAAPRAVRDRWLTRLRRCYEVLSTDRSDRIAG
ncbi:MAG: o-succinylbenzoate synthase [Mycobacteriales bacterium]